MKKGLSLAVAGVMAMAMMTGVSATDTTTTTTDPTTTASGSVYGQLSGKELTQMKFTAPIKIDFAVTPAETDELATKGNKLTAGNGYAVTVPTDSQVGVKLDKITISKATGGTWSLGATAAVIAEPTNTKLVNLKLNGTELTTGDNAVTKTIAKGDSFALTFTGHGSGATISAGTAESSAKAFEIVYTVSQVNP